MLDKLVRYCRARGTRRLVGWVLRENRAMTELALGLGFEVDAAGSDGSTLRLQMTLA